MQKITIVLTASLLLAFAYNAVAEHHEHPATTQPATQPATQPDAHAHAAQMASISHAVAVMVPTEGGTVNGVVHFNQVGESVTINIELFGLEPGSTHAIHVHQFGDITGSDGKSAGGHYNPQGHDHGLPEQEARHAGDLGNLTADDYGNALHIVTVDNLSIAGLHNPVIGRGVIVHAGHDDGGQPTGNAGARLAMGVIGIAKSE